MIEIDDGIKCDDGLEIFANCGIIGISADGRLYGGYDQSLYDEDLTDKQKIELAEYVIARWEKYKATLRA